MATFKVIFKGELKEGADREKLNKALAKLFNIPDTKSSILFSGKSYAIKKGLPSEKSQLLHRKLDALGIITYIVSEETHKARLPEKSLSSDTISTQSSEHEILIDGKLHCKYCQSAIKSDPSDEVKVGSSSDTSKSSKWESKFSLFNKLGADSKNIYTIMASPEYKSLKFMDKQGLTFNPFAFILGPLYYFLKKMWFKGAFIVGVTWLYVAILEFITASFNIDILQPLFWLPTAIICAQLANIDYYRLVNKDEKIWSCIPNIFSKPLGAIGFPIISLLLVVASTIFVDSIGHQPLKAISAVWKTGSDGEIVEIDLMSDPKYLKIDGAYIPVEVVSTDENMASILFNLGDGQQAIWDIYQVLDREHDFHLIITLHDGSKESMYFVRNL